MNAKSIVLFLVFAGVVVWFSTKDTVKPEPKPVSLVAGQQRQMEKAKYLEQDMQQSLNQRMQKSGTE